MKLTHQLLVLSLLLAALQAVQPAHAQDCSDADIRLNTQTDVDNFQTDYGPCTVVTGDLELSGSIDPVIENLDGLADLTEVSGDLWFFSHDDLTGFHGLSSLTTVGGTLILEDCETPNSLEGLSALTRIGSLSLSESSLSSLAGLSSSLVIEEWVSISKDSGLSSLDGLPPLQAVEGISLFITGLRNIDALSSVTELNRSLFIEGNRALTNLDALSNLTSVGGQLWVLSNDALTDCTGLATVLGPAVPHDPSNDAVGGRVLIESNAGGAQSPNDCLGFRPYSPIPVPIMPLWTIALLIGLTGSMAAWRLMRA